MTEARNYRGFDPDSSPKARLIVSAGLWSVSPPHEGPLPHRSEDREQ
jgi:hypothetical protein